MQLVSWQNLRIYWALPLEAWSLKTWPKGPKAVAALLTGRMPVAAGDELGTPREQ